MDKQMSLSALSDELAQVRTRKKEFLEQTCYYKGERGNKPFFLLFSFKSAFHYGTNPSVLQLPLILSNK